MLILKKSGRSAADIPTKVCPKCPPDDNVRPLSEFPTRHDRAAGMAVHAYCRTCKSRYEAQKRQGAAVRKTAETQRLGLNKKLPMVIWQDGDDKMVLQKGGKVVIDTPDFEMEIVLNAEAKRVLINALGGAHAG